MRREKEVKREKLRIEKKMKKKTEGGKDKRKYFKKRKPDRK